jgi:hypothetical protein
MLPTTNKGLLLGRQATPPRLNFLGARPSFHLTGFVPALYFFHHFPISQADYRDFPSPVSIPLLLPHAPHGKLSQEA